MELFICSVCLMLLCAWFLYKEPLWGALRSSYSTKWKSNNPLEVKTLTIWNDNGDSRWMNNVYIDISDAGLAVYMPFIGRFIGSVLIPWGDIDVGEKIFLGALARFNIALLAKQELHIKSKGLHLAIPYSYHQAIMQRKACVRW